MAISSKERSRNLIVLAKAHDEYMRLLEAGAGMQYPALMVLLDTVISDAMIRADLIVKGERWADPVAFTEMHLQYRNSMKAIKTFLESTQN